MSPLFRKALTLLVAALLAGCIPPGPTTRPASTRPVAGQRMFIIFAQEERDLHLIEQRRALGPGIAELRKRGVQIVEVVGTDPVRDNLEIPLRGFHTILLDEYMQPQFRADRIVGYDEILRVVDSFATTQP